MIFPCFSASSLSRAPSKYCTWILASRISFFIKRIMYQMVFARQDMTIRRESEIKLREIPFSSEQLDGWTSSFKHFVNVITCMVDVPFRVFFIIMACAAVTPWRLDQEKYTYTTLDWITTVFLCSNFTAHEISCCHHVTYTLWCVKREWLWIWNISSWVCLYEKKNKIRPKQCV